MKNEGSKNNLDHFMVIPFCAPEVAHLIDHRFEPVVHSLWLLFVEDESTKLSLDRLPLGDLGHLISFVRGSLGRPKSPWRYLTLAPYYTPLDIKR